jgi:hypothetical protein
MKRIYTNDFLLNRIAGLAFDIMMIASIMAIDVTLVADLGFLVTLLVLVLGGGLITYFYLGFVTKRVYPSYPHEAWLVFYGTMTGTASTGIALLREKDPYFETPAANDIVYGSSMAIPLGFPLLFFVGVAGWAFLSYSLMQPRKAQKFSPSNIEVNDIILCIDVSRSMLAEDIKPNRLEVAKDRIREFVKMRPTDRISVVIFSEKVFTLLPLTTDPVLVDQVLSEISIGYLGSGTNIGDGLALSVARAVNSETKNKVIVLLTDGVANVGTMTPIQAAEEAKKYGIIARQLLPI